MRRRDPLNPSGVIALFAGAVLLAVIGWFAGGAVRGIVEPSYETAVGVVDAEVGEPVATSSPTPEPTDEATPTPAEPTQTPEPEDTPGSIICEGAPPDENCDCELEDGEWVWVCELPTDEPTPSPTITGDAFEDS